MTRDDARNEIVKTLLENELHASPGTMADLIAELIAPELADAEKWRKFLAIQSCNDCPACPECPCDETNCPAIKIEDALEGKEAT